VLCECIAERDEALRGREAVAARHEPSVLRDRRRVAGAVRQRFRKEPLLLEGIVEERCGESLEIGALARVGARRRPRA
jgi:hypothetical protein